MIKRILIVGLGSIGRRHLRLARQLFPIADIKVLRRQMTDDIPEYSSGCLSSIEEAIKFSPQIGIIANPAPFHVGIAQALAEIGVNLLIEKPLAASMDGVERLVNTSRLMNTVLTTGYNLRFLPSIQTFRDFLDKDIIGRVLSVRCECGQFLPLWRPDDDYQKGVSANSNLGGGALLELSHELDYLRWIFGEVSWVKASLSRQSELAIDVEDSVHLILGFETTGKSQQLVASVSLDFIRHDSTRVCTAIGENGSLRWNGLTGDVELFEKGSLRWSPVFSHSHERDDSYLAEWTNFIDCIYGYDVPLVSGEDGIMVLKIIEAVRTSSESGKQVAVENKQTISDATE